MAPSRRKAPAQLAPQTLEQAIALLSEYRDIVDTIDELGEERDRAIARIKGGYDEFAVPLDQKAKELFRQLRAWWAVASPELTEGKRKSIELAGVMIGERTTPPALVLPKGSSAEAIVDDLLKWLGGDYVITTHKLDKQTIIKALRAAAFEADPRETDEVQFAHELRILREELKLTVGQKEEFFIDRPAKTAAVDVVAEPAE
jgi:phage host-nuclease inhibitor protein Gam